MELIKRRGKLAPKKVSNVKRKYLVHRRRYSENCTIVLEKKIGEEKYYVNFHRTYPFTDECPKFKVGLAGYSTDTWAEGNNLREVFNIALEKKESPKILCRFLV